MLELKKDLKDFHNAISGKTEGMDNQITKLSSDLDSIKVATTDAVSKVNTYYESANSKKVINKLSMIESLIGDINASLTTDLKGMVTKAAQAVGIIDEMYKCITDYDSASSALTAEQNKEEPSYSVISLYKRKKDNAYSTFYDDESKATRIINELKTADSNLAFIDKFTDTSFLDFLDSLEWGTCELRKFKTSSGKVIEYYFYIPNYVGYDGEIPLGVYMHGGSPQGTSHAGFGMSGLTKYVLDQSLNPPPPCYLIMPFIRNFEGDNIEYDIKEVIEHEMANPENTVDESRVFVTGHSYGGIKATAMMNMFPEMFSCVVGMSGTVGATEAYQGKDALLINGSGERDPGRISDQYGRQVTDQINSLGGNAFHITFPTNHRGTRDQLWSWKIETPDGEYANPLFWAIEKENSDVQKG